MVLPVARGTPFSIWSVAGAFYRKWLKKASDSLEITYIFNIS
jgi:hypothetical protein